MESENEWLDNADSNIRRRLNKIIEDYNIQPHNFARSLGIPLEEAKKHLNPKRKMPLDVMAAICVYYDINANWLFTGTGEKYQKPPIYDTDGLIVDEDEYVFISYYNFQFSDSKFKWFDHEHMAKPIPFRIDWLRKHITQDINCLSVVKVSGDSMTGVLENNDTILVDHTQTEPRDSIYAIRLGNDVFVKRIQRLTNTRLQIISANTNYPPFEIDLNSTDTDFTVIGKVVWLGRLL